MKKIKWYFKKNHQIYNILYEDDKYILIQNNRNKLYSFGLKKDFGSLYGFPVNQSCLNKDECISILKQFIEIDKKYNDVNKTMAIYKNMLIVLKEV